MKNRSQQLKRKGSDNLPHHLLQVVLPIMQFPGTGADESCSSTNLHRKVALNEESKLLLDIEGVPVNIDFPRNVPKVGVLT
jgi:hypothetical protein